MSTGNTSTRLHQGYLYKRRNGAAGTCGKGPVDWPQGKLAAIRRRCKVRGGAVKEVGRGEAAQQVVSSCRSVM